MEKNISDNESDTATSKIGEATNRDWEEGAQEIYTHDDGGREVQHATEDTFLQMILNSEGDGTYFFTSWEPGRHDQFYFLVTTAMADYAAE